VVDVVALVVETVVVVGPPPKPVVEVAPPPKPVVVVAVEVVSPVVVELPVVVGPVVGLGPVPLEKVPEPRLASGGPSTDSSIARPPHRITRMSPIKSSKSFRKRCIGSLLPGRSRGASASIRAGARGC
jgi:hypothetical protein